MRRRQIWMLSVAAVAAVVLMAVTWALFGQVGMFAAAAGVVLAVVAAIAARQGRAPQLAPVRAGTAVPVAKRRRMTAGRLVTLAGWAGGSQRDWDTGVRPTLLRLLDVLLSERFQSDHLNRPDLARDLLGDQLWRLIDPARGICEDRSVPGPERAALTRILTKLEA
jgi:hypothetical protein